MVRFLTLFLALAVTLTGCSPGGGTVSIPHIHGMGFTPDGLRLYVAAHDGLVTYSYGRWEVPNLPRHDYMGFAATDNGFFSSGHPGPGTKLSNPLGLVRSTDWGKTLTLLGFHGEIDFHVMAAGYRSHAVYVINTAPNPKLPVGLHYTLDQGKSWTQARARGARGQPLHIAVHPARPEVLALATAEGLFLSTDHGQEFSPVGETGPVSAAAFTPDGQGLLYGYQTLNAYDLETQQISSLSTPALPAKDAIGFIALNPAEPREVVFATHGRQIHRSVDAGKTWTRIAADGKGISK